MESCKFTFSGIESRGFWAKAWKLSRTTGEDVEDCYQEIVLAATEIVAENPEITEQQPGYLLNRATWKAQNTINRRNHTYLRQAHNYQVLSLDEPNNQGDGEIADHHEAVAAPVVDQDTVIAVRQVVEGLDEKLASVATMLMRGMSKSNIAREMGVSPAAVTGYVKKLQAAMMEVVAA